MKNIKNPLTQKDKSTLREARKILSRLTARYNRWNEKIYSLDIERSRLEEDRFQTWMENLYDQGMVDFCEGAFVDIQPIRTFARVKTSRAKKSR